MGNDSGELWRIDVTPGAITSRREPTRAETLRIERGLVRDIVLAPDGASAVVVLDSEAPSVVDLARWTSLGRLPMDRVTLRPRLAFGADGRFLRAQTQLERWDFRAVRAREVTFANGLSALAVSADGRYAAVGAGGAVALVDTEARQIMATHRWQDNIVKTCAFGPGTSLAASGLGAVAAQRFDPLAPTPPFRNERALRRLGVLADGSGLGVDFTRAVVRMWTDRPEAPIADLAGIDLAVSANGREALVVDADRALWRAHDLHAGGGFERLVVDPAVVDVAIDDAGVAYVASADGIRCFDADGGDGPRRATPDADLVVVAASADLVAAGAKDGSVRVWKVGEVEPWAILRDHDMRADTLVIEPRGRWLASGAWDGRLHFLRRPDDLGATSLGEAEAAWGTSLGALLARR
ncbi:MAG: hypothetical protein U1F43_24980 [Myxococcota bacterium]